MFELAHIFKDLLTDFIESFYPLMRREHAFIFFFAISSRV